MIKLLFIIVYLLHFCGCCWSYGAKVLINHWDSEDTWIQLADLTIRPFYIIYINAVYYSCCVMVTVGFPPTDDPVEKIYSMVLMVILSGTLAYAIGAVASISAKMFQDQTELMEKIRDMNHYMQYRKINSYLQTKIRRHLEYLHDEEKYGSQRGQELLQILPVNLKEELNIESYFAILKKIPILSDNFSDIFLQKLSTIVQEILISPQENIYQQFDEETGLFYILSGVVELYCKFENNLTILKTLQVNQINFLDYFFLKQGNIFGEYSFFSSNKRIHSAKSLVTEFHKLLNKYQNDFEHFAEIKDRLNLYKEFNQFKTRCQSCRRLSHDMTKCPLLTYNGNQQQIITKFQNQTTQKRTLMFRKPKKKFHALKEKLKMREGYVKILNDNDVKLEFSDSFYYFNDSVMLQKCQSYTFADNKCEMQRINQKPELEYLIENFSEFLPKIKDSTQKPKYQFCNQLAKTMQVIDEEGVSSQHLKMESSQYQQSESPSVSNLYNYEDKQIEQEKSCFVPRVLSKSKQSLASNDYDKSKFNIHHRSNKSKTFKAQFEKMGKISKTIEAIKNNRRSTTQFIFSPVEAKRPSITISNDGDNLFKNQNNKGSHESFFHSKSQIAITDRDKGKSYNLTSIKENSLSDSNVSLKEKLYKNYYDKHQEFLLQYEQIKQFKHYFPQNNLDNIITKQQSNIVYTKIPTKKIQKSFIAGGGGRASLYSQDLKKSYLCSPVANKNKMSIVQYHINQAQQATREDEIKKLQKKNNQWYAFQQQYQKNPQKNIQINFQTPQMKSSLQKSLSHKSSLRIPSQQPINQVSFSQNIRSLSSKDKPKNARKALKYRLKFRWAVKKIIHNNKQIKRWFALKKDNHQQFMLNQHYQNIFSETAGFNKSKQFRSKSCDNQIDKLTLTSLLERRFPKFKDQKWKQLLDKINFDRQHLQELQSISSQNQIKIKHLQPKQIRIRRNSMEELSILYSQKSNATRRDKFSTQVHIDHAEKKDLFYEQYSDFSNSSNLGSFQNQNQEEQKNEKEDLNFLETFEKQAAKVRKVERNSQKRDTNSNSNGTHTTAVQVQKNNFIQQYLADINDDKIDFLTFQNSDNEDNER